MGHSHEHQPHHNGAVPSGDAHVFHQPPLEGLEVETGEAMEFGNCLITSAVTLRKRQKGMVWSCHIYVEPDLFHPEQQGTYEAIARGEDADRAHAAHLRPGDRAMMRGFLRTEESTLLNGEPISTSFFYVKEIEPFTRSPRKSVTLFEQQQKR